MQQRIGLLSTRNDPGILPQRHRAAFASPTAGARLPGSTSRHGSGPASCNVGTSATQPGPFIRTTPVCHMPGEAALLPAAPCWVTSPENVKGKAAIGTAPGGANSTGVASPGNSTRRARRVALRRPRRRSTGDRVRPQTQAGLRARRGLHAATSGKSSHGCRWPRSPGSGREVIRRGLHGGSRRPTSTGRHPGNQIGWGIRWLPSRKAAGP